MQLGKSINSIKFIILYSKIIYKIKCEKNWVNCRWQYLSLKRGWKSYNDYYFPNIILYNVQSILCFGFLLVWLFSHITHSSTSTILIFTQLTVVTIYKFSVHIESLSNAFEKSEILGLVAFLLNNNKFFMNKYK